MQLLCDKYTKLNQELITEQIEEVNVELAVDLDPYRLKASLCGMVTALACRGRNCVFDYIAKLCRRLDRAALSSLHYR